ASEGDDGQRGDWRWSRHVDRTRSQPKGAPEAGVSWRGAGFGHRGCSARPAPRADAGAWAEMVVQRLDLAPWGAGGVVGRARAAPSIDRAPAARDSCMTTSPHAPHPPPGARGIARTRAALWPPRH